jgi:hypothetical protein
MLRLNAEHGERVRTIEMTPQGLQSIDLLPGRQLHPDLL